jgi:hypothetical protein
VPVPGEHRVDAGAQLEEHRLVGRSAQRGRASVDRRPAVGARHHVDRDVGPAGERLRAQVDRVEQRGRVDVGGIGMQAAHRLPSYPPHGRLDRHRGRRRSPRRARAAAHRRAAAPALGRGAPGRRRRRSRSSGTSTTRGPGSCGRLALYVGRRAPDERAWDVPAQTLDVAGAPAEHRILPLEEAEPALRPAHELRWERAGLHLRLTAQGPWGVGDLIAIGASVRA